MRFIIMHKTNAGWEAGEMPSRELIARVGALVGELVAAKMLLGAEGLRASSQGVRVTFAGETRTIQHGPFTGEHELPAGFTILRAGSIQDAIDWASRQAAVLGDGVVDIRPLTEPWDVGLAPRPDPPPARRYMALRKATAASEAGASPSPAQQVAMARLIDDTRPAGTHVTTASLKPSAKGRRFKNSRHGVSTIDGPFTESKELIAGYVMVSAASLDEAAGWAARYLDTVQADEVDLLEVDETR